MATGSSSSIPKTSPVRTALHLLRLCGVLSDKLHGRRTPDARLSSADRNATAELVSVDRCSAPETPHFCDPTTTLFVSVGRCSTEIAPWFSR
jgi:hypothetical protein